MSNFQKIFYVQKIDLWEFDRETEIRISGTLDIIGTIPLAERWASSMSTFYF